jgi:Secreted repeat of unknown function
VNVIYRIDAGEPGSDSSHVPAAGCTPCCAVRGRARKYGGLIVWPAFTSNGTPRAAGGAKAVRVATIIARGGRRQVTYNRHPLYYYVGDQAPGETHGQGLNQFGGLWYVVSPSGNAVTSAPRTAPAAQCPKVGY